MAADPTTDPKPSVRDSLAMIRTRLANERTMLAYARTAIMLGATGVTLLKFFPDESLMLLLGVALIAASLAVGGFGARRFVQLSRRLES